MEIRNRLKKDSNIKFVYKDQTVDGKERVFVGWGSDVTIVSTAPFKFPRKYHVSIFENNQEVFTKIILDESAERGFGKMILGKINDSDKKVLLVEHYSGGATGYITQELDFIVCNN